MTENDRGVALVLTLLIMALITSIGLTCVLMARAETQLGSSFGRAAELVYAADAGVTEAQIALCRAPLPLTGGIEGFDDHQTTVVLADGATLNLSAETAARQRESDAVYGPAAQNPDAPQWRLAAHGPLASLIPAGIDPPVAYVAVWLADDGEDGDGNPEKDTNGTLMLQGAAYGPAHGLRIVQVVLHCVPGLGKARVDDWRIVR